MLAPDVELRRDFQQRFPFVSKIGVELIKCKNECRQKTAYIAHLERKLKAVEAQLRAITDVSGRKFAAWEKLVKERWKEEFKNEEERTRTYNKAFDEHFEEILKEIEEHTFKLPPKKTVDAEIQTDVGKETDAIEKKGEDDGEVEIICEKRAEVTKQLSPSESGNSLECPEAAKRPRINASQEAVQAGPSTHQQQSPVQQQQFFQPVQIVQQPQQVFAVPQQLIYANGVYYATTAQPTTFVVRQTPTIQYVMPNGQSKSAPNEQPKNTVIKEPKQAVTSAPNPRKRPKKINRLEVIELREDTPPESAPDTASAQVELDTGKCPGQPKESTKHGNPQAESLPEETVWVPPTGSTPPPPSEECASTEEWSVKGPTQKSRELQARTWPIPEPESIGTLPVREQQGPSNEPSSETTSEIARTWPIPEPERTEALPASEKVPHQTETPLATSDQSNNSKSQPTKTLDLAQYTETSDSPRPSSSSSSAHSLTATPKPIIRVRRRIPYKFTPENSDRITVANLLAGAPFSSGTCRLPHVPNWNHYRAKHVCRLSISTTGECGKVANGRIRELTVHVDYETKKRKTPLILCLYYYMRSYLQYTGSTKFPIKYQKEISPKLRKYHVRFIIPANIPIGDVFYVTGHIGTSPELHDMGELPPDCIAVPIDIQSK
ncbi:hypothetical protein QR680_011357 [Steinernema hermaphroditum]|uniref:Uncharacterized protein n=1 Tax=Steinernema hermaphroditum TaxID=289476 RepID=A0AA39MDD2_9BILA|nr:hypothetical protein QR680_011357 [Steinernema hermaphroditum]